MNNSHTNYTQQINDNITQPRTSKESQYTDLPILDATSERALWQSVIMQAVFDIASPPKDMKGRIQRAKTVAWFSIQDEDFLQVCSFAGFSPETLIKNITKLYRKAKAAKNNKRIIKNKHLRRVNKNTPPVRDNGKISA